jgi:hypothetical protein
VPSVTSVRGAASFFFLADGDSLIGRNGFKDGMPVLSQHLTNKFANPLIIFHQ